MNMSSTHEPARDASSLGGVHVVSIEAKSSVEFLEAAFDCYARGQVFAVSRADSSLEGLAEDVEVRQLPDPPRLGWAKLDHAPRFDDTPAQIVFTSGTEGRPKAIVLSHRNLAHVVEALNTFMGVTGAIREYIGVPVTYSFGLARARAVSAVGGMIFLPERFDPVEIRNLLEKGEINAISAVPSLWQIVLANPEVIGTAGAAVRWIEIGSQFMSAADKEAMRRLFPNAKILQHYGLTEASRSCFLDISAGDRLESVGRPLPGAELRIGQDGSIAIRGPHVALGRLTGGGAIAPLTDEDGWLVTRDRGAIDAGWVSFLGRLDDQINVSGIKLAAEELERRIAEQITGVAGHIAVAGVPDRLRGEAVLVAIEADAAERAPLIQAAARIALERKGIAPGGALHVVTLDRLPRTGTDKIRRAALRDLPLRNDGPKPTPADPGQTPLTEEEQALAEVWRRVVGPTGIAAEESFYDAGGDSLSSLQIGIVMEGAGYGQDAVRAMFEGRSLREVARLTGTRAETAPAVTPEAPALPEKTARSWALSLTRGVMVLSVLLSHWGPGLFGRLGIAELAERTISILYRMGTPGFATVFGMGIGYFMLPAFAERRGSVLARLRSSFLLVASGLILIAAVRCCWWCCKAKR
jgi:acyl-CoA synthetase (AMP-forming)/AMP-acid ligase II